MRGCARRKMGEEAIKDVKDVSATCFKSLAKSDEESKPESIKDRSARCFKSFVNCNVEDRIVNSYHILNDLVETGQCQKEIGSDIGGYLATEFLNPSYTIYKSYQDSNGRKHFFAEDVFIFMRTQEIDKSLYKRFGIDIESLKERYMEQLSMEEENFNVLDHFTESDNKVWGGTRNYNLTSAQLEPAIANYFMTLVENEDINRQKVAYFLLSQIADLGYNYSTISNLPDNDISKKFLEDKQYRSCESKGKASYYIEDFFTYIEVHGLDMRLKQNYDMDIPKLKEEYLGIKTEDRSYQR